MRLIFRDELVLSVLFALVDYGGVLGVKENSGLLIGLGCIEERHGRGYCENTTWTSGPSS